MLPTRTLGTSGLTVSTLGPYKNEELLARALEELEGGRDRVIIATKFGFKFDANGTVAGVDSRPEHIREAVEGSLRRLATDRSTCCTNIASTPTCRSRTSSAQWPTSCARAKCASSAFPRPANRRSAERTSRIRARCSRAYSLWERNLEPKIIPLLRELGIGLVPFAPLGRGFLTGAVRRAEEYPEGDFRRGDPRYQGENFDANVRAASAVRELAARKGATAGQVALAWLLHKGDDIVPIPGTKRRKYLEENVGGVAVSLSAQDMAALDAALAPGTVSGPRYNERQQSMVDR